MIRSVSGEIEEISGVLPQSLLLKTSARPPGFRHRGSRGVSAGRALARPAAGRGWQTGRMTQPDAKADLQRYL